MQLNLGICLQIQRFKRRKRNCPLLSFYLDYCYYFFMFDPHTTRIKYPENTDGHYLEVKKNNGLVFDGNYPYIDRSKKFKFIQFWIRLLLNIIVFPMCYPYMGLIIKNRKNIKKYKEALKDGAITVSNHIHMWDYIAINKAIRHRKPHVIVWAPNVRGENAFFVRMMGGVPIPDGDLEGKVAFNKAIEDSLARGEWLQVYAEGSMWECYPYIRPFKLGAASLAIRTNKPILPIGFSFRKPSWIRKHIFKQEVAVTLNVGEPIFKDESLSESAQRIDLTTRVHNAVCLLAGIEPKDNPYEAIFDNSKRAEMTEK